MSRLVVVTGGPGAGKTAVLELVRQHLHPHVAVLPESASILFEGGFPRRRSVVGMKAAQRAIYHVQVELEAVHLADRTTRIALCDRGTLDGLAYWPDSAESFLRELGTTIERELSRYSAVIHLRTPTARLGYNHDNGVRIESARHAGEIDRRIEDAWSSHPRRFFVESSADFMLKAQKTLALIESQIRSSPQGSATRTVRRPTLRCRQ